MEMNEIEVAKQFGEWWNSQGRLFLAGDDVHVQRVVMGISERAWFASRLPAANRREEVPAKAKTWTCEWCGNVAYSSSDYSAHLPLCDKRLNLDEIRPETSTVRQRTDEMARLLDLYLRGFRPTDVARVLVEKYRVLPGNVGRDIFDSNPAYGDGELLGDVKLPDMDIIQEDRRIASLQPDEIARFVHVKLACRERQLLTSSKENIQLRESIPSPEDFAYVVAEGGKLAEQIRAEMQEKLDELWNEAIEWKRRAETAEAELARLRGKS